MFVGEKNSIFRWLKAPIILPGRHKKTQLFAKAHLRWLPRGREGAQVAGLRIQKGQAYGSWNSQHSHSSWGILNYS